MVVARPAVSGTMVTAVAIMPAGIPVIIQDSSRHCRSEGRSHQRTRDAVAVSPVAMEPVTVMPVPIDDPVAVMPVPIDNPVLGRMHTWSHHDAVAAGRFRVLNETGDNHRCSQEER